MPWFPDFVSAAELARREVRAAGHADPVAQYLASLATGETRTLETVWPGEVVVYDPRAGEIRGHKRLRRLVRDNQVRWAERHASTEIVASTVVGGRAVVELLVHLADDSGEVLWPLAVVSESTDDRSVVFRTYCSQVPVDGSRHLRPPILDPGNVQAGDVVGRYQSALAAGDVDGILHTFGAEGCVHEAIGPRSVHCGTNSLRAYFSACFGAGGGIRLEQCAKTDDGVRCTLEYNYVGWGSLDLPPQAGIAVFERDADGRLAAVRLYDDVDAPVTTQ